MAAHLLLHGILDATIVEANHFNASVRKVEDGVQKQRKGADRGIPLLYATVELSRALLAQTRLVDENRGNPQWNESFRIYCAHFSPHVVFTINLSFPFGDFLIGRAYLPARDILDGQEVDRWLDILDEEPLLHAPKIHVRVRFTDVTEDRHCGWGDGVGDAKYPGVPFTFFKQQPGCRVTLYQDAHSLDTFKQKISLAGGLPYEPGRCWEDIFDAISNARHLVYITGWSVYTEIKLVRDGSRQHSGGGITIGELLKKKAREGVRVLMMVWDDSSSPFNLGFIKGSVGTHDIDTEAYFKGSDVHCVLCTRDPAEGNTFMQAQQTAWLMSHHQKSVIVDSDMKDGGRRRIVSFIGGLDLTDGRYDTQDHSLFRTLNTVHSEDFYQGSFEDPSIKIGGPREPWHDIHSKIEGPAAWDVLRNFEQRWKKQVDEDLLVNLRGMEDMIIPSSQVVVSPNDPETWNVQVFRSIDSSACVGFSQTPEKAAQLGLVSSKGHIIDKSIQDAYIHAIRRAKHFIYIENQYFFGSSYGWRPEEGMRPEDIKCIHLIPRELSLKIVSKIEAGDPFAVYIVIPMWPEGQPATNRMQAMLYWQRKTMEMMYYDISIALEAKKINANPRDYLSFFCLGNREAKLPGEYQPTSHPWNGTDYARAQQARRSMIYVHSKMMIVDDEYIIVGSANLNQRSMDGARDSEIAMGAYQPFHLNTRDQFARGQIYGFRMSLWCEHLGMLKDEFQNPGSLKCIQHVNKMANQFWELYASGNGAVERDLPGHLLSYPIAVAKDGTVTELPGMKFFPDTQAPVLGTFHDDLLALAPAILTT
ncbi:hypothetical protein EJB05_11148, partial [Eragrostis curvula]